MSKKRGTIRSSIKYLIKLLTKEKCGEVVRKLQNKISRTKAKLLSHRNKIGWVSRSNYNRSTTRLQKENELNI